MGVGAIIDIWKDPWVPWLPNFLPLPKDDSMNEAFVVACLINQSSRAWNVARLNELFDDISMEAIIKITLPSSPRPNKLIWILDPKGKFSVKSAFQCSLPSLGEELSTPLWKSLWMLKLHDRLKMLIWRIGSGTLPTNQNFSSRVGFGNSKYPLCCLADETPMHLFFQCSVSKALWFGQTWGFKPDLLHISNCSYIVKLVTEAPLDGLPSSGGKELHSLFLIRVALTLEKHLEPQEQCSSQSVSSKSNGNT